MRKITYILVALILLISLTTINIFAEEVNKASIGQKIFSQAIENNEITINNNEDDSFKELDAIIGDNEINEEEMSKVVGDAHNLYSGGVTYQGEPYDIENPKHSCRYEFHCKASAGYPSYKGIYIKEEIKKAGNTVYSVQYAYNSVNGNLIATLVTTKVSIAAAFADMVTSHINTNEDFLPRW